MAVAPLDLDETPAPLGIAELHAIVAHNPAAAAAYVKVYDTAAAPDGSAVPVGRWLIPAESDRLIPYVGIPRDGWWLVATAITDPLEGLDAPTAPVVATVHVR